MPTLETMGLRAIARLLRASPEVCMQCIEIARAHSSSGAFKAAFRLADLPGMARWNQSVLPKERAGWP